MVPSETAITSPVASVKESAHTYRHVRWSSGVSLRRSSVFRIQSSADDPAPAQRALKMPGAPSSASIHIPLSSARAGKPVNTAAAFALIVAFSKNVDPVSSGSGIPGKSSIEQTSTGNPDNICCSSSTLWALCVAITSLVLLND